MKRPRGSLGLEAPNSNFTIGVLGNELIDFLIDTGVTYSVVDIKVAQKTSQSVLVMGVSGGVRNHSFLQPLECQLGDLTPKQKFLYMSEFPIPLLGQDLLCRKGQREGQRMGFHS